MCQLGAVTKIELHNQVAATSTLVTESDCKKLAGQLEAWAAAGQLPQGQQLADDMRSRIEAHAQRIPSLLAQGQVIAMSYCRFTPSKWHAHKMNPQNPSPPSDTPPNSW